MGNAVTATAEQAALLTIEIKDAVLTVGLNRPGQA